MNLERFRNYIPALLFLAITLLGASLLTVAAYSAKSDFRVAVGELGDGPLVSGFNGDEPGAPRYRWTGKAPVQDGQTTASVTLPLIPAKGANNRVHLQLGAANAKDSGLKSPPLITVSANGVELGKVQTVEGQIRDFELTIPDTAISGDTFRVDLRSPVFQAGGRTLGVKVQEVNLLSAQALRFPPFEVWFWAIIFAISAGLLVAKIRRFARPLPAALGGLLLLAVILTVPYLSPRNLNLWYGPTNSTPYYLQIVAWVMLALAALVWVGKIGDWLWELPDALEKGNLARNLLLLVGAVYLVYAFAVVVKMDYIGHADYADNGIVARNILRGNGFAVDYAAQFYTRYTSLPHPADTWPLLQPIMTVPFFAVFGATAFAAKLPNLILMLALTWAVFRWTARYFNKTTALGAALLTLLAPAFFETVVYPINDLAFSLFTFLLLMNVYRAAQYRPISGAADVDTAPKQATNPPVYLRVWNWLVYLARRPWLWCALWGGLLLWSKPSGGIVLVTAGLWLLWQKFWNRTVKIEWSSLVLWGGLVILIFSPYLARSMALGGTPVYSTERYDAWLLEYGPWERIYDPYYVTGQALPDQKLLLNYGWDTVLKVKYNQFRKGIDDFLTGDYVAPLVWLVALAGLVGLPRRRYGLAGLVGLSFVVYLLFINVYWHYEIRYFMVWLPWIYILGMFGLDWLFRKLREGGERAPGRLGAWLLPLIFAVMLLPNVPKLLDPNYTSTTGIVTTAEWLKANTPADAVVMTRVPWQLSFHADRHSVMFPNNITTLDQLRPVLRDYKVKYLQFSYTNLTGGGVPDDVVWRERQAVWPLIKRENVPGFKLIYDKDGFLVYEITGQI